MARSPLFRLGGVLLLLGLVVPSTYAQQPAPGGDRARMQALEQTPLTGADKQLFLLDGEIWLRRRGQTRFQKGETVTDFAADVAQRRATLRERALTDETPYDLVLDLGQAADRAFVQGLAGAVQATERAGFYRVTLTKAQTVPVADRGIAMAQYPLFPGDAVGQPGGDDDGKAPAAKAQAGQGVQATEVLFSETVEGAWPGVWTTGDDNATSGADYWGNVNCKAHGGSGSAWSADEGDQTDCTTYDNDMEAFMYNTAAIDVSGHVDVMLSYWLWYQVEAGFDFFRRYDSHDGVSWTLVDEFDGSAGDPPESVWGEQTSSLVGFTNYYVKFEFFSDGSVVEEGAYVDDIEVTGNRPFEKNTTISSVLTDVESGSVAWGDYDNDGDLDLLLTGSDASGNPVSKVYENDPVGTFSENTALSSVLTGVYLGSVAWGDYDNDGDLDILITGEDGSNRVSKVYENDGAGGFSENTSISSVLTDVEWSSVAWGDYDNDGDLDLLLTGWDASLNPVSKVYENDPVGTFSENTALSSVLTDVYNSSVAWGDYDNDGDLDLLLTGCSAGFCSNPVSEVYDNVGGFPVNTAPAAPTNLAAAPGGTTATLSWDAATDAETPTDALAYTLRIGTTPGGFDVMAPMSVVDTGSGAGKSAACSPACPDGWRKIVAMAPVRPQAGGASPSWQVEGLASGLPYYWSVQAVDGGFAGGAFAAEGTFLTSGAATRYVSTTGNDAANVCVNPADPCATIAHAISQASAGDVIEVAAGTYAEPGLVIDKAVNIEGAGVIVQ